MKKVVILFLSICFSSDFIPQDQKVINYTQVFFKWPQINNSFLYRLYLNESSIYNSEINSIVINDLDWDSLYQWYVCGLNELDSIIQCYDEQIFHINSLPNNYPENLNILAFNNLEYQPGITMLDFESLNFSLALDFQGNPVWYADRFNFNNFKILTTQFLDNGNVLGFGAGSGYEFNLDSDIIFETPDEFDLHHSIIKTNNESYFLIDAEIQYHPCPVECNIINDIPWQGDRFIELDQYGNIIWEWNTFDYLSLNEYNPFWIESYDFEEEFDWTHSNSVFYDNTDQSVYISIRNLSRVTSIDYHSKDINWNLGDPDFMDETFFEDDFNFSHQHSAQISLNNTLLFFDNGRDNIPELSRCIEIDFNQGPSPMLVWEYVLPDSLLSLSRGECDRLENGNTLISAGRTGNILEVNLDNEIVWHLNVKTENGTDVNIYRSERIKNLYPASFSFSIENLMGTYQNFYIENNLNTIDVNIYNTGWADQTFNIKLFNEYEELLILEELFISNDSFELVSLLNIFFNYGNYILEIHPITNPDLAQRIEFSIQNVFGDFNQDGFTNIQDIIIMVDWVLNLEFNNNADLNEDLLLDIFDIILLLSIII